MSVSFKSLTPRKDMLLITSVSSMSGQRPVTCQSFQDSHHGISTPRTSHNPMASFVIVQAFIEEGAFDRCS